MIVKEFKYFFGRFVWSSTILGMAIAGCAAPNIQPRSEVTPSAPATITASSPTSTAPPAPGMAGVEPWTTILQGESVQELTFATDGSLLYQDEVLLPEIPVSYGSNDEVTYAQRLLVSEPSPSGRFQVVRACESTTNETGVCWAVFLLDRQSETIENISIAKYGGQEWVEWSADERYAVFAESMEGVSWFVVLDLQTKESKMFEQTAATVDLSSFQWLGARTFQVNLLCDDSANCPEPFQGDITSLFNE